MHADTIVKVWWILNIEMIRFSKKMWKKASKKDGHSDISFLISKNIIVKLSEHKFSNVNSESFLTLL